MITAIFGLAGVVVGGIVTGGVNLFLEHRREQGELRRARRLVAAELHALGLDLEKLARERETPAMTEEGRFLAISTWDEWRGTLALLPESDWELLPLVYDGVTTMRRVVLGLPGNASLTPLFAQDALQLIDVIKSARSRLGSSSTRRRRRS